MIKVDLGEFSLSCLLHTPWLINGLDVKLKVKERSIDQHSFCAVDEIGADL